MMLVTCVDIVLRKLGHPFPGAYDITKMAAAVTISCALPYTTAVKGHVAVEFFFPPARTAGASRCGHPDPVADHGLVQFMRLAVRALWGWVEKGRGGKHDPAIAGFLGALCDGFCLRRGRAGDAVLPT